MPVDGRREGLPYDPWPFAELEARSDYSAAGASTDFSQEWLAMNELLSAAQAAWPGSPGDARSPMRQHFAAVSCVFRRPQIEAGSGVVAMEAVSLCARHGLVMPPWLGEAFCYRHDMVTQGRVREWSDPAAFGSPHKTDLKAKTVYTHYAQREAYLVAIRELAEDPELPLDTQLWARVAKRLPVARGETTVRNWIAGYVQRNEEDGPPLRWVKEQLKLGRTLAEVLNEHWREWWRPHLERAGFVRISAPASLQQQRNMPD